MTIEITSIPDRGRTVSVRRFISIFRALSAPPENNVQILQQAILGLIAIASILSADALMRSYKYYSRVVDARLAAGYSHSRAGLYAAPRRIHTGDKISKASFIAALRRAGYVAFPGGNAWSGSFHETAAGVEVRTAPQRNDSHSIVLVKFEDDKSVSELVADGLSIESLTLEPEVLSSDPSYKTTEKRTLTYNEIPPVLVHAILSIEDQRFFQHSGLDPFGIARALFRNASEDRLGQGGSTITQQLVKNTYLTSERTLKRKYSEAMLAFALEKRLTKQEIFALYCNEVYLGQRGAIVAHGVKEAAHLYFGKEPKELSLPEAATLAGMIQSPANFSPLRDPEAARTRRNLVLNAMARNGWIQNEQASAASNEPIVVAPPTRTRSLAPYFVDHVNRIAEDDLNASSGRQRIYTTIDLELQQLAETAVSRQLDRLDRSYKFRDVKPQAALVALDPRTGHVLAMVGGRDYGESQLNRATDARRQPGSTFKPFVYAAALEDGMSPVRTFADAPREFVYDRNKVYRPNNYGGGYSMREVTMRTALVNSLNVVTVDVALQTGLARVANLTESIGLPRPERYPSLALGTEEVTPLELAAAYATLANGGQRVEPKVIVSVDDPPAAHATQNTGGQVISPTTAYMITNMLSAVIDHGTGRAARDVARFSAVAGKTGTSRDGWFVGYTPNLVCVVWIGFDDNRQLGLSGAEAALPAWSEFMKAAVSLRPEFGGRNFECPEGIRFVEIDADAGLISTLSCPHRELIAVTDRLAPNLECLEHGNLPEADSITEESSGESTTTVMAQHSPRTLYELALKKPDRTRVEIDAGGRSVLVNDMR